MEIKQTDYYRLIAPRPAVIISTIDNEGRPNAAPFSFITPVSSDPPLVAVASFPTRHTLANIRETKEFVINIAPEELLEGLWVCGKSLPRGVNEIKEAKLTEQNSKAVRPPRIAECAAWIEAKLWREIEAGDHFLILGEVVFAEVKENYFSQGRLLVDMVKPLLHVGGRYFAIPEKVVVAK